MLANSSIAAIAATRVRLWRTSSEGSASDGLLIAVFVVGQITPHAGAAIGSASMCAALVVWALLWLGRERSEQRLPRAFAAAHLPQASDQT
jgi:hypothetical protein